MHRRHREVREHARDRGLSRRALLALAAPWSLSLSVGCRGRAPAGLVVACSSSLADFLHSELALVRDPGARAATVVEGATATLARQLIAGAPYHCVVSADESPMALTALTPLWLQIPSPFAEGAVALVSARPPALTLEALARDERFTRVALPNPETAPFGRAARQALEARGLWSAVSRRVLLAENVRHALSLVDLQEVDAAFTARSLLVAGLSRRARAWSPVARQDHSPLRHLVAITRHADGPLLASARALVAHLRGLAPSRLAAAGMDPLR
jgi:molybdate transport system substrate-binding protein